MQSYKKTVVANKQFSANSLATTVLLIFIQFYTKTEAIGNLLVLNMLFLLTIKTNTLILTMFFY